MQSIKKEGMLKLTKIFKHNRQGYFMATWVDDIVQALKNLGGEASLSQIYIEVNRIRAGSVNPTYQATIRRELQTWSADSSNFNGKTDYFHFVQKGVWALSKNYTSQPSYDKSENQGRFVDRLITDHKQRNDQTTWLENVIQALQILGGQATLSQIYHEVKIIRQGRLPKMWQHIIQDSIYQHSSDTQKFQGNDLFQKVGRGVWSLRDKSRLAIPTHSSPKPKSTIPDNYLPQTSYAEIENILRTIKQYREYSDISSQSWNEYMQEFFSILGFSTLAINTRLFFLDGIGRGHIPKAIVAFLRPTENYVELIPGILWESYLHFACSHYQTKWGILTNGLQLKIYQFQGHETQYKAYWQDLDGIVCQERMETFIKIFKLFSLIKEQNYGQLGTSPKINIIPDTSESYNFQEKNILIHRFLQQLHTKAMTKTKLHAKATVGKHNYFEANAGKMGFTYGYKVSMDQGYVDLYIDTGDRASNKDYFQFLYGKKNEIEKIFGGPLDWELLPNIRASRVRHRVSTYGVKDMDHWAEFQDLLIDGMIRMENAFRPYIRLL